MLASGWCGPDEVMYPFPRGLPMGFSWALFLAQEADADVAECSLQSMPHHVMVDRGSPLVMHGQDDRACLGS